MKESKTFSSEEAADLLGVSTETIRRKCRSGEINAARYGNRGGYRISKQELAKHFEELGGTELFAKDSIKKGGDDFYKRIYDLVYKKEFEKTYRQEYEKLYEAYLEKIDAEEDSIKGIENAKDSAEQEATLRAEEKAEEAANYAVKMAK